MQPSREKPYPSDASDEGWALVAPYLALPPEDAPRRSHPLREVFYRPAKVVTDRTGD